MRLLICKHIIYLFLRKVMATNAHISLWSENCLKGIHTSVIIYTYTWIKGLDKIMQYMLSL